jgi:hypothetical protein
MLLKNEPEEVNAVIAGVFHATPAEIKFKRCELGPFGLNPNCLIFTDSILVYTDPDTALAPRKQSVHRFIEFCSELTGELLSRGLPVRGAITKGKFSVIKDKSFTGRCIIEAHDLAQRLDLAACAIAPEFEPEVWGDRRNRKNLRLWKTPLKNSQPQEMLLLDYSPFFRASKPVSRATLIECFSAFRKGISPEALQKLSNTLQFLERCLGAKPK